MSNIGKIIGVGVVAVGFMGGVVYKLKNTNSDTRDLIKAVNDQVNNGTLTRHEADEKIKNIKKNVDPNKGVGPNKGVDTNSINKDVDPNPNIEKYNALPFVDNDSDDDSDDPRYYDSDSDTTGGKNKNNKKKKKTKKTKKTKTKTSNKKKKTKRSK